MAGWSNATIRLDVERVEALFVLPPRRFSMCISLSQLWVCAVSWCVQSLGVCSLSVCAVSRSDIRICTMLFENRGQETKRCYIFAVLYYKLHITSLSCMFCLWHIHSLWCNHPNDVHVVWDQSLSASHFFLISSFYSLIKIVRVNTTICWACQWMQNINEKTTTYCFLYGCCSCVLKTTSNNRVLFRHCT